MVFVSLCFEKITPPLALLRLLNLNIKKEEIQKFNDLIELFSSPITNEQIKKLIAHDWLWMQNFLHRLELNLQQHHSLLYFFTWFKALFKDFHHHRSVALQHIHDNNVALNQLKDNLKAAQHTHPTLPPEDRLALEKWVAAYYTDPSPSQSNLSHAYLTKNYTPAISIKEAHAKLENCQRYINKLKIKHPLILPPSFSLHEIYHIFKEELKNPYHLKKIFTLIIATLMLYLGLATSLTIGFLIYGFFGNTLSKLWQATKSITQHLHWGWQRLTQQDQLKQVVHFGEFISTLENNAIFLRDYLSPGPLALDTLDAHFFKTQINTRVFNLKMLSGQLSIHMDNIRNKNHHADYQKLINQFNIQITQLQDTALNFSNNIANQMKFAFKTPYLKDLTPRFSTDQIDALRDFVVVFGNAEQLKQFNKNTNPIKLFLNTRLTVSLTTPRETSISSLPFGTHQANKQALKINKKFILFYQTNSDAIQAVRQLIAILSGKKETNKSQLTQCLQVLKLKNIESIKNSIGHHLFLTKTQPTLAEIDLFPEDDKAKIIDWYKKHEVKIKSSCKVFSSCFKKRNPISPIKASNIIKYIQGNTVYQQLQAQLDTAPSVTLQSAQAKIIDQASRFHGKSAQFISFIYPLWENEPPQHLIEICLKKRLNYSLEHPSIDNTNSLIDDMSLHLPNLSPNNLNLWATQKLQNSKSYQEEIEKQVLMPLTEKGLLGKSVLTAYRRKGLNEALTVK